MRFNVKEKQKKKQEIKINIFISLQRKNKRKTKTRVWNGKRAKSVQKKCIKKLNNDEKLIHSENERWTKTKTNKNKVGEMNEFNMYKILIKCYMRS